MSVNAPVTESKEPFTISIDEATFPKISLKAFFFVTLSSASPYRFIASARPLKGFFSCILSFTSLIFFLNSSKFSGFRSVLAHSFSKVLRSSIILDTVKLSKFANNSVKVSELFISFNANSERAFCLAFSKLGTKVSLSSF